ncbi:hypothetical protein ACW9UR_06735 [Halovulum sp. GXIMD14794]
MDQEAKLAVFQAQVENVRSLKVSMRQLHRSVNEALRSNDAARVSTFTKTYALLFCAWAESNFSKVLHTPYGFEIDEIQQVKNEKSNGISAAWKKAVELGLRHLDAKRGSFRPNAQKKLYEVIDTHVFDPSLLRNKLAHGQWVFALNRDNDAVQDDLTRRIDELDIVKVGSWVRGHELMADTVETLIESPKNAFMRDWYHYVVDIEKALAESEQRTLEDHVARLKAKDERTGARGKRTRPV